MSTFACYRRVAGGAVDPDVPRYPLHQQYHVLTRRDGAVPVDYCARVIALGLPVVCVADSSRLRSLWVPRPVAASSSRVGAAHAGGALSAESLVLPGVPSHRTHTSCPLYLPDDGSSDTASYEGYSDGRTKV
jgi:hypothetical protein